MGIKPDFLLQVVRRIKKGKTPFATMWVDPEGIMLREISQQRKTNREKYDLTFMWSLTRPNS